MVTCHDGWGSGDLLWVFEEFEELLRGDERYAIIIDASGISTAPDPLQRKIMAEFEDVHRDATARVNVGVATVITSPLVRGVAKAMSWIARRPAPEAYVGSTHAASTWCLERLKAENIPISDEAMAYVYLQESKKDVAV